MDPLILSKLQAFAARRRRLIILRGVCAAVAMLLATMMVVALLDRFFILPDWFRWTLSGVAYLAVIVAEWRACLRLLWHAPGSRDLARLVERTAPELREDLLSAVELGEEPEHYDSPRFRELVQAGVAERMAGLDTERLLPTQLLRRSMLILGAIVVVLIGAMAFSGLQFGTMLLRAMFPMANLDRVSSVKVAILAPNPAEMPVPQGDSIPLIVETSGKPVAQAYLETFSKSGSRSVAQMTPSGRGRFTAQIQVAREDVQYRVRAGDALTRKYRLHAAARPHVVRFHKTYRFPAYAQLPEKTAIDDTGDLAALEGTEVEMLLETDQPVRAAELRVETGKDTAVQKLEPAGERRLRASVKLNASGTYRVHLVSAESAFENKFSPEYELRAEADLIPKVEIETPERDTVATTSELLDLTGAASDDLALAALEQRYRVNEGPWKKRPLPLEPGPAARIETQWDLSQEGFRPGDIVTTKLVATDRKGLAGESKPVVITLAAAGFDSRRAAALLEKQRLLAAVSALQDSAEILEKRCNEARAQADKAAPEDAVFKQAGLSLSSALDDYEQRAAAAIGQLAVAIRGSEPGHDSGNLVLLGRALSRLQASGATLRFIHRQTFSPVPGTPTRELLREAIETSRWILPRARQTEDTCRHYVTAEELDLAAENLQVAWQEQRQLAEQAARNPDKAGTWKRVATRTRAILAETAHVEEGFKTAIAHAQGNVGERFKRFLKRLGDQRAATLRALEAEPSPALLGPTQAFAAATAEVLQQTFDVKREFLQPPTQAYDRLRNEMQPAWAAFEKLRKELDDILRNEKFPEPLRQRLAQHRWLTKAETWKTYGDWEESRPDADAYFVQDLRSIALVLVALRGEGTTPGKNKEREPFYKKLTEVDRAFRVLEVAHDLFEVASGFDHLAAAEKWDAGSLRARSSNPVDWQWLANRWRVATDDLSRIGPPDQEARPIMQQAQQLLQKAQQEPPSRALQVEMVQRFSKERAPVAVSRETAEIAERIREAIELLRPTLQKARQTIAEIAPKLTERMQQLAKQAQELQQRTEAQAKAEQPSPDAAKAETQDKLAEQQQLNAELETVKDAVRADAQRQDLMEKDGRERARDADDALALLREPPTRAEQALNDAATASERPEERNTALRTAAEEQQKLSSALEQIAKHYDALEKGKPEETRLAMREEEKKLGVKEQLDAQYEAAERLAEASEGTPEEMLKKLENALPQNPLMRQELSSVSKNTLHTAAEKLTEATAQEQKVAESVNKLASEQQEPPAANPAALADGQGKPTAQNAPPAPPQPSNAQPNAPKPSPAPPGQPNQPSPAAHPLLAQAATQQTPIAESATLAGEDIQRAGRHEERLRNPLAGQELQRVGQQVQQTAEKQIPQARDALAAAQAAREAQPAVELAKNNLQRDLDRLTEAASGKAPMPAAAEPSAEGKPAAPASPAPAAPAAEKAAAPGSEKAATPGESKPAAAAPAPGAEGQPAPPAPGNEPGQPAASEASQMASSPAKPGSPTAPAPSAPMPGKPGDPAAGQKPATPGDSPSYDSPRMAGAPMPMPSGKPGDPTASPHMMPGSEAPESIIPPANTTASPQQQVWMARALDSLDAAIHSRNNNSQAPGNEKQTSAQQQGQPQPGKDQPQNSQESMSQAQKAMSSAAQAQAASMRSARTPPPNGEKPPTAKGGLQAKSEAGAQASAAGTAYGAIPNAGSNAAGDWGKLPKVMAEQLTQGQRESVSSEYRNQVETYYRVIAERAKKP